VHVPDPDYAVVVEHDQIGVRVELARLWLLFMPTFAVNSWKPGSHSRSSHAAVPAGDGPFEQSPLSFTCNARIRATEDGGRSRSTSHELSGTAIVLVRDRRCSLGDG
jgi:hypothetical protein